MSTPTDVKPIYVDAWVLRCIFNWSLKARVRSGELRAVPKNKPKPSTRPQDPPGAMRQGFRYFDRKNNEVATVQYWHVQDKLVSPIDPKAIYVGPQRYMIFPDDLEANPEHRFEQIWKQKLYGFYRKAKCFIFGPVAWVPRET